MLFEQSSTVAEACTQEFEGSPQLGVSQYSLVLGQNCSWINIELYPGALPLESGRLLSHELDGSFFGVTDQSAKPTVLPALARCNEAYTVGTGIVLNTELIMAGVGHPLGDYADHLGAAGGRTLESVIEEDSQIIGIANHCSFVGQFGGVLTEDQIWQAVWANGQANGPAYPGNPIVITAAGSHRNAHLDLCAAAGTAIEYATDATQNTNGLHTNAGRAAIRRGQLRGLTYPSISLILSGSKLPAALVAPGGAGGFRLNDRIKEQNPQVQYFVEWYNDRPQHWTIVNPAGSWHAVCTEIIDQAVANDIGAQPQGFVDNAFYSAAIGGNQNRADANNFLYRNGFKYVFNRDGWPHRVGHIPTFSSMEGFRTPNGATRADQARVRYSREVMYHVGHRHDHSGLVEHMDYDGITQYLVRGNQSDYDEARESIGRYTFKIIPSGFLNQFLYMSPLSIPGGSETMPYPRVRRGIGDVLLEWTSPPRLELEMVRLSAAVNLAPVVSLWTPEHEWVFQTDASTSSGFQLQRADAYKKTVLMSGMRINEVFTTMTLFARLRRDQLRRFEFVETLRPTITRVDVAIGENSNVTSRFSSQLLYRFFRENTLSTATYEGWLNNSICVLSPQQLGLGTDFSEGLAKVVSINFTVYFEASPNAKRLIENYEGIEYTGSPDEAELVSNPHYVVRASFDYENRSSLFNARMAVVRKRNARKYNGETGLVRKDRGLPFQRGLK